MSRVLLIAMLDYLPTANDTEQYILLDTTSQVNPPPPFTDIVATPRSSPLPRHKSSHPADVQERKRRRKRGL